MPTQIEELKRKREPLFRQLEINPQQLHLALEIKIIDDQIAECIQQLRSLGGKRKR